MPCKILYIIYIYIYICINNFVLSVPVFFFFFFLGCLFTLFFWLIVLTSGSPGRPLRSSPGPWAIHSSPSSRLPWNDTVPAVWQLRSERGDPQCVHGRLLWAPTGQRDQRDHERSLNRPSVHGLFIWPHQESVRSMVSQQSSTKRNETNSAMSSKLCIFMFQMRQVMYLMCLFLLTTAKCNRNVWPRVHKSFTYSLRIHFSKQIH